MRKLATCLLATTLLGACSFTPDLKEQDRQELERYVSLDEAWYRDNLEIDDSPGAQVVTFSTRPGFQARSGMSGTTWNDFFLIGYYDKRQNKRAVQVYASLKHTDRERLAPTRARYGEPPRTSPVEQFAYDTDCGSYGSYASCVYLEVVGFFIAEAELQRLEEILETVPDRGVWKFRLSSPGGRMAGGQISRNEFAALLNSMREYRQGADSQ